MKREVDRKRERRPRRLQMAKYLIVTDGASTEKNYFEGLRGSLQEALRDRIMIRVETAQNAGQLIERCSEELARGEYREVWIVFDRDQVPGFDRIIEEAARRNYRVGWSNPCFEVWFLAHFNKMRAGGISAQTCIQAFKQEYNRLAGTRSCDDFKSWKDIYVRINSIGSEDKAISAARTRYRTFERDGRRPSDMADCTTVYLLLEQIRAETGH